MGRRGLIAWVIACVACTTRTQHEPAGEAPAFHDQHLFVDPVLALPAGAQRPVALALDVQAQAIHVSGDTYQQFARHGSAKLRTHVRGSLVAVPGDHDVMVSVDQTSPTNMRVFAAWTVQAERWWPVLDYGPAEAIAAPLVVGDRVAIVLDRRIVHAAIRDSTPHELALAHEPRGRPTSDGRHLVWIAQEGEREFVLRTDASFAAVEVVRELSTDTGSLVAAAPVGDSVVLASIERSFARASELVVRRARADGVSVELLRAPAPGDDLRLLPDAEQAWLYTAHNLWWIGETSHAKIDEFDAEVEAIGVDDGLLIWQRADGLHVAGQPQIEFHAPFRPPPLMVPDDDDDVIWGAAPPSSG